MKYILTVVVGSIVYGFLPIFVKNLQLLGLNSESIIFYRFLFTVILCFVLILVSKKSFTISMKQFRDVSFFGILGLGVTSLVVALSLDYISTGLANMIYFGYPAVVMIIMITIYKEKVSLYKLLSVILAILGVFALSQIDTAGSIKGILLALIAAFLYPLYIISNKRASFRSLDTVVVVFYTSVSISIFFFIQTIATGTLEPLEGVYMYYNLIALALCTIIPLTLVLYGVRKLGSSTAAVINMFEPTTTVIAGIFIHKEIFSLNILLGSSLVILSTFIIMLENIRLKKTEVANSL